MLVVAGISEQDGPHKLAVFLQKLILDGRRQLQILPPCGMLQSPAIAAHHQSHLGGSPLRRLTDHLILVSLAILDGVPVHIQDKADGGVLLQIRRNGLQGPVIGPVIGGIVVERPVVEDGDAGSAENLRHHIPGGHHVVAAVGGAVVPGPDDALLLRRGVAFAAVGMDDQDLGGPLPQGGGEGLSHLLGRHRIVCGVGNIGKAADNVPFRRRGHQGPALHAVIRRGLGHQGRLLHRNDHGILFLFLSLRRSLLPLGPKLRHFLPGAH